MTSTHTSSPHATSTPLPHGQTSKSLNTGLDFAGKMKARREAEKVFEKAKVQSRRILWLVR